MFHAALRHMDTGRHRQVLQNDKVPTVSHIFQLYTQQPAKIIAQISVRASTKQDYRIGCQSVYKQRRGRV